MKSKQLVETLTDAAVMDASHISSAIELDGYYGVYETMTEHLNEYIDGFYRSNKDSLLHRYIRKCTNTRKLCLIFSDIHLQMWGICHQNIRNMMRSILMSGKNLPQK